MRSPHFVLPRPQLRSPLRRAASRTARPRSRSTRQRSRTTSVPAVWPIRRVQCRTRTSNSVCMPSCCAIAGSKRPRTPSACHVTGTGSLTHPDDDPGIHFGWDDSVRYPPARALGQSQVEHSLRIDLTVGDGQRRGIHQSRVPVRAGIQYRGLVWVRTWDFAGRSRRRARAGPHQRREVRVSGRWQHHVRWHLEAVSLHAAAGEDRSTGQTRDPPRRAEIRGRVWIDQVSLIPGDAVDEVRADVFERVRLSAPASSAGPAGTSRRTITGSGRWAARRAARLDQPVLVERARTERLRH